MVRCCVRVRGDCVEERDAGRLLEAPDEELTEAEATREVRVGPLAQAVREIADAHFAVVRSQLCASGCRHGLILNFAKPTLEVRRVVAPERSVPAFLPSSAEPLDRRPPRVRAPPI